MIRVAMFCVDPPAPTESTSVVPPLLLGGAGNAGDAGVYISKKRQQRSTMMELPLPPMSVVLPGSTILEMARVRKTRLNEACAVAIQSVARTKLAAKEAERRKAAVVVIQSVIRMRLAVKERLARERFLCAVITIQCWARQLRAMYFLRLAVEEQQRHNAAIAIQCWFRCIVSMTAARQARESKRVQRAAITILCLARQHKARIAMQKAKEERAATAIICLLRQHQAKAVLQRAREERDRLLAGQRRAEHLGACATVIQAVVRQRIARRRREAMEKAWVVFRVLARKCLARSFRRNATIIQSAARMHLVKRSLGPIQAALCARERSRIVLQGFGRIVLAKIAYNRVTVRKAVREMEELHAKMLQTSLARPMLAKKKVQERQRGKIEAKCARTIQSLARMMSSKRRAKTLKQEKSSVLSKFVKRSVLWSQKSLVSAFNATQGASNRAGSLLFNNPAPMRGVSLHVKTKDACGKAVHSIYSIPGMGRLLSFVLVNIVVFTVLTSGRHTPEETRRLPEVQESEHEMTAMVEFAFEHMTSSVDMAY